MAKGYPRLGFGGRLEILGTVWMLGFVWRGYYKILWRVPLALKGAARWVGFARAFFFRRGGWRAVRCPHAEGQRWIVAP